MIDAKIKNSFFDRPAVIAAVGRARAGVLSKAGAFIRRRARSLIRYAKKVASPGSPPKAHTRDGVKTLRNVQFGYDAKSKSVVVGPIKLNGTKTEGVPALMEAGGTSTQTRTRFGRTTVRTLNYAPHPFMGPALEETKDKLPETWKDSVVRTT